MKSFVAPLTGALLLTGCAIMTPPPAPAPASQACPIVTAEPAPAPAPTGKLPAPIKNIETEYQAASNKALAIAGSPQVDADTLAEMRALYLDAGRALARLKREQRGEDYGAAREAVDELSAYVRAHAPQQK